MTLKGEELKYSWDHGIISSMSQFAMKAILSLLSSLPPSLGWYFSQLTTHTCMHICIYINDMGIWTAQSNPWSQRYAKGWVTDRKEDISECMLTTWWFGHLWFSCSRNCSFHTDRRWRLGWLEWDKTLGCPQTFSGLLWPWFGSNVLPLWSQSHWLY